MEQFNQILETIATLSNEETMKQIASSMRDIETGHVTEINSVNDL